MLHFPVPTLAFESILEDFGPPRSPLDRIRTAAHAAYARRRRRSPNARREVESALASVLASAENPFPALRRRD